jgi:transposase
MSGFIQGEARHQTTLFPEALDDYIKEENPIRVIDAFVDNVDLAGLGFKTIPADTGRPAYHPSMMLKLYIYGYLNRIQSSRRLEREAGRNVELMWLLERLSPDFKTIADFRKDNSLGIKNTCRTFIDLCRQMNMFTDTVVAIDGSQFKAVNNSKKSFTPSKLKFHKDRFEKHLAEYLKQLDEADKNERQSAENVVINDKITWLKKRLVDLKAMEERVSKHPEKQVSITDPDSRLMKTKGMSRLVCYSIQSAVDSKHHLIVAHEVTNKPDRGQLCRMGIQAQAALKEKKITVIADKGYYSGVDIKNSQDEGMAVMVPKGDTSASEKKGIFNRSLFKYDAKKDVYTCPANKEMTYRFTGVDKGLTMKRYFLDVFTCRACNLKPQCTRSKQLRRIGRWEHTAKIESMEALMASTPNSMLIRKQTVEHPFGTIKSWMGSTHFLTRHFKNVSTEMNLHVLAYNLTRMIKIKGAQRLICAMQA